jgi:hypothetical protein
MRNVRLAALAIILAGGVLLARPAEGTYTPPPADSGEPLYCCCVKTLLGCGDYCCSRTGCSISVNGCKLTQT